MAEHNAKESVFNWTGENTYVIVNTDHNAKESIFIWKGENTYVIVNALILRNVCTSSAPKCFFHPIHTVNDRILAESTYLFLTYFSKTDFITFTYKRFRFCLSVIFSKHIHTSLNYFVKNVTVLLRIVYTLDEYRLRSYNTQLDHKQSLCDVSTSNASPEKIYDLTGGRTEPCLVKFFFC